MNTLAIGDRLKGLVLLGAALTQGCATTTPAPVQDRAQPSTATQPRPPGKPVVPLVTDVKPAPVVVKPLSPAEPGMHVVKQGDTMFSIAKANGVTVRDLAAWNNIADPSSIRVGHQLRLTPPAGAAVATPAPAVDEAAPVAVPAPAPAPVVIKPIDIPPPAPYSDQAYAQMSKRPLPAEKSGEAPQTVLSPRTAGDVEWAWPVQGKVIADFNESSNKGIAIAGKMGQRVLASAAGRVIFSGNGPRGLGQMVVVRHNATYLSVYAHNSKLLVKEGQPVTLGQAISEMGNSDADQVKLHFEIRVQGKPVDPIKFLPER
jgi:lipoprotein NlpD